MGGKYKSVLVLIGFVWMMMVVRVASNNYGDALSKCILFFEGQRSGKLPSTQRMTWRKDSALHDGFDIGVDLVGGYYDAGDNVKFSFPMAFTITTLAWSLLEFGHHMKSEYQNAADALKWGTDYLLKATSVPGTVVALVGDPYSDHACWERPEDMDTARTSYVVNTTHPGSDVSAEIAAALAASSLVFKSTDYGYSQTLLERAHQVYHFADQNRGNYDFSLEVVCPFYYCDGSGYMDELLWGAAWLYKATKDQHYWKFIVENIQYQEYNFAAFGWDSKYAGTNVLLSRLKSATHSPNPFVQYADKFVCSVLPESPSKSVSYSPGGLLNIPGESSNTQRVTAFSFLLLVYSRYMTRANNRPVECGNNVVATPSRLAQLAKSQVDYLLGSNPLKMSYMVGYGTYFPSKIHHRGSTLPSIDNYPKQIKCRDGDSYFRSTYPNPNQLIGAIVGGPDINDQYNDSRSAYVQSEPTTYINAPFVGVLAYFKSYPS
uniref:Endoglucanase n=1 Tax=Litchi chinensis TaxID=151069 RepID=A0A4P8P2L7_LITCN|nr:endo-(1,4)-beta-D-glucanase [Litchi chinensis]